ncbi:MAG: bifunctional UDP-N-acetylglucosamine diphosphorylase/glucosamine-1-phosphate N-acetyltransferase GlmU [Bdellovibrionaceae bacterium]|nr:bifunctional UDP-N-acetylglucosamine diphosphorylase/glucosamine-1-phosphate N-acetyltransferase GlmU [Pseudobdellovibrionaceae bacterium]
MAETELQEKVLRKVDKLTAIILAAGKGTRMKSPLPKVLHPVAGSPMINYVIAAARDAGATEIRLVVGHGQNLVRQVVEGLGVICFEQKTQLGTANAVASAGIDDLEGDVLILNGDHPLLTAADLKNFIREFREEKCELAVVTAELEEPGAFGRIVRHKGEIRAIVEAKDASSETLKIKEVNTGIYLIKAALLQKLLPQVKNHNARGEYYLTDIVGLAIDSGKRVRPIPGPRGAALGVNSQWELSEVTREVFLRKAKSLMDEGVVIIDPKTVYIEESVQIGAGTVIYPNVFLRGRTRIGSFCVLEPNIFISDSQIADSTQIRMGSHLEKAKVAEKCTVGPYARLRPDSEIAEEAQIGNFVELKKVKFGRKSKAAHLTYLGDAEIGEETNIGCGTITCNYAADRKKYRTVIGNRVFVGSDTQFIAPVTVGDDAVIGSGSTITKDVPAKSLAVARARQFVKENWQPKISTDKKEN